MKKFLAGLSVLTLAAALFVATFPSSASAQATAAPPSLDYVLYNGTVAAADAAILVGPYDTSKAESLTIELKNAGSGARTAIVECWDPSGAATVNVLPSVAVGATDSATIIFDPRVTAVANVPARHTVWAVKPCYRTSVKAAAATGTMRVVVEKRQGVAR